MRNRHVLVSGGSSGIGYAIAKRCVIEGASQVAMISRSPEKAQVAVNRIKEETGLDDAPLVAVIGDLQDVEAILGVINAADKTYGTFQHLNTLFNCAGEGQSRHLHLSRDSSIRHLLAVNLESAIMLSKHVAQRHYKRLSSKRPSTAPDSGLPESTPDNALSHCIVNVSSLLAKKGSIGTSVYAASKAGLLGLTSALVVEAASMTNSMSPSSPSLRVNAILPGYIDTPMLADMSPQWRKGREAQIPSRRFGTPDEVADAAIFLASNEYANNCLLNVDGGLSAT